MYILPQEKKKKKHFVSNEILQQEKNLVFGETNRELLDIFGGKGNLLKFSEGQFVHIGI